MMNPNGNNPLWGGNLYCSNDAAAVEMNDLINVDEPLAGTEFRQNGDLSPMPEISFMDLPVYDRKPLTMVVEPEPQIGGPQYEVEIVKGENLVTDSEGFDKLLKEVCGTMEPNYEFLVGKVDQGNDKHLSKIYKMVNEKELYAKPEKDIPIKIVGAKLGHIVQVSMRYKAGCHYNTPVRPCPEHITPSNPDFSFSVPRLASHKVIDGNGHPTLKVPVTSLNPGEDFNFSILFHCRNSCHKQQGKNQEMILQLFDSNDGGELLHHRCIDIRICENVNRDIGVHNDKLHRKKGVKRLDGKNTKMVAAKRKTEVDVAVGEQVWAMATASPLVDHPITAATPLCFGVRLPDSTIYKAIADIVKAMNGTIFKLEDREAPPLS